MGMSNTCKGKLVVREKGNKKQFRVLLPTKKGEAEYPISEEAHCFRDADAEDGCEVDVIRGAAGTPKKVTIPGKPQVAPAVTVPSGRGHGGRPGGPARGGYGSRSGGPQAAPLRLADPSALEMPFHNPYNFIPFAKNEPARTPPTALSADEGPDGHDRLSGVLELDITTRSPLLSCEAGDRDPEKKRDHQVLHALTIGDDVIVPATGVRGFLRSLITILTGGPLTHLDDSLFLCQGRDLNLGPRGKQSPSGTPKNVFLAKVVHPGSALRPGQIQVGKTELVLEADLMQVLGGNKITKARPKQGEKIPELWVDYANGKVQKCNGPAVKGKHWQVKLSGRPVNTKGKKHEGLFKADGQHITLPPRYWAEYSNRHRHGDHLELHEGDLVWLEPTDPEAEADSLSKPEDIASLQWARWGRKGDPITDLIPQHAQPDATRADGRVSEVTNLFGQVPLDEKKVAPAFAGRIRPENLVFKDAAKALAEPVPLAPMGSPHPGCVAFYRDNPDPQAISRKDPLKGYKVYRAALEGPEPPWRFETQGVYDDDGRLKPEHRQRINQSCQLLPKDQPGTLRIAFRALSPRELALLIEACRLPWRLGGGKPLGLGLCRVEIKRLLGEVGEPLPIPDNTAELVADIRPQARLWEASQQPVERLRYPRFVDENNNKIQRGGHVWFQKHASPKKGSRRGELAPGLQPAFYLQDELKTKAGGADAISGQVLKPIDPDNPKADQLYGYDGFCPPDRQRKQENKTYYGTLDYFDPEKHSIPPHQSGGKQGQNRDTRQQHKKTRRD
jgi:hypothetical protein